MEGRNRYIGYFISLGVYPFKDIKGGLDVGFSYDGDTNCCLWVDENGTIIDGDVILSIYGTYMKE